MPDTTGLIPDELLSNINEGDCVLFLGADLPLGYSRSAPPCRAELAACKAPVCHDATQEGLCATRQADIPARINWTESLPLFRYPQQSGV